MKPISEQEQALSKAVSDTDSRLNIALVAFHLAYLGFKQAPTLANHKVLQEAIDNYRQAFYEHEEALTSRNNYHV